MPAETRTRLTLGVAAALVVVIVVAAILLIGGRAPIAGDASAAATTAPGPATSVTAGPTATATGDPAAPDPDGAATPVEAVRGFVASLGAGNQEAAFRLMHPRYRAAFGSYAAFRADPAPEQLFGSFAVLGAGAYQSAVFAADVETEQVSVVSTYGTVTRDGQQRTEAIAVATRRAPSGWLVDASGTGGSVFQTPGVPGTQLPEGADLVLWTPSAGLVEVLAVVDGEPRTTVQKQLDAPSGTVEVRVDDYSPGVQQAAIGLLRKDGSVATVATWFTA